MTLEEWRAACVVRPCPWSGHEWVGTRQGKELRGTHRLVCPNGVDIPIADANSVHEADEMYHCYKARANTTGIAKPPPPSQPAPENVRLWDHQQVPLPKPPPPPQNIQLIEGKSLPLGRCPKCGASAYTISGLCHSCKA